MLYIKFNGGLICRIAESVPADEKFGGRENGWLAAREAESFVEAETWSKYITAMTGDLYLAADNGAHCWPRFEVFKAPKVGDKVSYGFNGDCRPDGEIVKISKMLMVTTSTGKQYRRKGLTAGWYQPGGTWSLVPGHIDERNPSF